MEEYQIIRQIGRGAFGQALLVRRVVEPDIDELFVIKQINMELMTDDAKDAARKEIDVRSRRRLYACLLSLLVACLPLNAQCLTCSLSPSPSLPLSSLKR